MSEPINIQTISSSPTTLANLSSITILNANASNDITLTVSGSLENLTIESGQTITLNASVGFKLPELTLIGDDLYANVVST